MHSHGSMTPIVQVAPSSRIVKRENRNVQNVWYIRHSCMPQPLDIIYRVCKQFCGAREAEGRPNEASLIFFVNFFRFKKLLKNLLGNPVIPKNSRCFKMFVLQLPFWRWWQAFCRILIGHFAECHFHTRSVVKCGLLMSWRFLQLVVCKFWWGC